MTVDGRITGVEGAVRAAGGQGRLARTLGVSQQAVSAWLRRGFVPVRRVVEIESQFGVLRTELVSPRLRDLFHEDETDECSGRVGRTFTSAGLVEP